MSIETNKPTAADPALDAAARKLLDAAMGFYEAHKRSTGGAAVVWLTDAAGRMVVLTRGEYRETLMTNVHRLQVDTVRAFGDSEPPVEKRAPSPPEPKAPKAE